MSLTRKSTDEVSEISCTPSCIAKYKLCREQVDLLIREVEDLRYDGYTLRKAQRPTKEKLEAQTKDLKRVKEELSEIKDQYSLAKYTINKLTAELAASNARFRYDKRKH